MAESSRRVILDGVDSSQIFHFPKLLGSCSASLQPGRLLIALLMVTAVITFGRIWDASTEANVHPDGLLHGRVTSVDAESGTPLGVYEATADLVGRCFHRIVHGAVNFAPDVVLQSATVLFVHVPMNLWRDHLPFALALGLVLALVYVVGGGALCRMAACQFAGQVRLKLDEAIDFALVHWIRLVIALLLPLALAAVLAGIVLLLSLPMLAPGLDILGGLLYGVALLIGFVLAFVLVGYLVAFGLIVPAVASENCDGPDAGQKAISFVYLKPLHLIGYALVGFLGLVLGYLVVSFFAMVILNLTSGLFGWISGNPALDGAGGLTWITLSRQGPAPAAEGFAAQLIMFWQTVVVCTVWAYVVSFLCDVTTRAYLLLRKSCDDQGIEEIWWPGMTPGTIGTAESRWRDGE